MWIETMAVQLEYKVLESSEVASKIPDFIESAQNFVIADLSEAVDMEIVLSIMPFPEILKQLCKFKAQEKALTYYYQTETDTEQTIKNVRTQYNNLIELIRSGKVLIGDLKVITDLGSVTFG